MNPAIQQLYKIASKPKRLIIGLMSGTSLDGLDVALCSIEGYGLDTKLELVQFETVYYKTDFKNEIKSIFSKKNIDLEKLCLLNSWVAKQHANIVNALLKKWNLLNEEVDLIASHGQTIYHAPKSLHRQEKFGNATLQIGDGDHLAVATGIITISDFRQKHIAAGGEGAPLAVYGDIILFSKKGEDRVLLNIGGIANFTYLPASQDAAEIICTDTGPGNTIMDNYIQQQFPGKYFDENAAIAFQGKINTALLNTLKDDVFFRRPLPKTTGPELFNLDYLLQKKIESKTEDISAEDTMATLNRFTAETISTAIKYTIGNATLIISGGGVHNCLLIKNIIELLPKFTIATAKDFGIDPDAKEAILFALLANETVCAHVKLSGVSLGKISFPS